MQTTVPCQFCGRPTIMTNTKKCDGCWEVARGLSDFLRAESGRAFVRSALAQAERDVAATAEAKPVE